MNHALRERLLEHITCDATVNERLAPHTTFRIGGPAAIFAQPVTTRQVVDLMRLVRDESVPHFYLGSGSNLLVSDAGYDGVVIRAHGELEEMTQQGEFVIAGPSAKLLRLTTFVATRELSGMEPLSGIPGSIGGGLYMNAGAYGGELCDTFVDADVITPDGQVERIGKDEVGFGYRSSPRLQPMIILQSRYHLKPGDKQRIFSEMRRVWRLRREKQPLDFPSAGSIFKRPPGYFAGRLIEDVGGKGLRIGGAMVSPKHAGIFINAGGATAADVTALVREVRKRVYDRFHVLLENEVKPVGFEEDPFAIEI
jgi:UDP-N-acetylmuramate dehydrogenase